MPAMTPVINTAPTVARAKHVQSPVNLPVLRHHKLRRSLNPLAILAASVALASPLFATPTTSTLTTDGAWTWFNDPRALYSNGSIYTGWVNKAGNIVFATHNLSTQTTNTGLLYNGAVFQQDDHDNPAFVQTSSNTFTSFYSPHGGAAVRTQDITVNANGSFTFGSPLSLNRSGDVTGSNGWSYANPFRLASENKTYLFSRGPNFNPVMRVHDDAQPYSTLASWSTATTFISNPGQRPYVKYDSNNTDRVGIAFTDGHPRNVLNNIYYAYMQGGSYYKIDGTKIKDVSAGPILLSDMTGAGTVFDHTANPAATGNNSWIWDVATDTTGHPVLTYATFPDNNHHQYHWARWDGSQWIDRTLLTAGPSIALSAEANYSAGIVLDHTDPTKIYMSWMNAGTWNLQQWKTNNDGLTWSSDLIANGSGPTDENIRPYVPLNHPADTDMVLYLRGQYDYWNFSQGVGYQTAVKLWSNPTTASSALPVPEPSTFLLVLPFFLLTRRRPRPAVHSR
jgi:hypothetical protein